MNHVALVGRLTRDPELRELSSGTMLCMLGLAVDERYKTADGSWASRGHFFDVNVWGAQGASCARYLSKGRRVGVSGRLRFSSWEKDGQKRSKVDVVADSVEFLDSPADRERQERRGEGEGDGEVPMVSAPYDAPPSDEGEMPF
jgi:single-strand DNA-binding protein